MLMALTIQLSFLKNFSVFLHQFDIFLRYISLNQGILATMHLIEKLLKLFLPFSKVLKKMIPNVLSITDL